MLTPQDIATIQADMASIAGDAEQTVTYLRYASTTPGDKAAGIPESAVYDPPEGTPVGALVYPYEVRIADQPGGRLPTGETVFRIRQTLLTPRPQPEDRINWQGATWAPTAIDEVRLGATLAWTVRCRKA